LRSYSSLPKALDLEIKSRLPRAWPAFFSRFGKLTEAQRASIPAILAGEDVVLVAPTATGKTEAVAAPVAEMLDRSVAGVSVLYVSPTRALVNDLYRRLTDPLSAMHLRIDRRTGDHPDFSPANPPEFLITTPESFDSMLCRYPASFETIAFLVLDEVHLLDGTPRGDQIRVLLRRLRQIRTEGDVRFYALSATVGDARALADRFWPGARVIRVGGGRGIEYEIIEPSPGRFAEQTLAVARRLEARKLLVFCNSRAAVEEVAQELNRPPFQGRVYAHHGSLSKDRRESVEQAMSASRVGVCVATMTLELGIDIGDIDLIVLWATPPSIHSLMQRIGRGNRRLALCRALCLARDPLERALYEMQLAAASKGDLPTIGHAPYRSVAIQQILSFFFQRKAIGRTSERDLCHVLEPVVSATEVSSLVDQLAQRGWVRQARPGLLELGDYGGDVIQKGRAHSNIEAAPEGFQVVDAATGRPIGHVDLPLPVFVLGGQAWVPKGLEKGRLIARSSVRTGMSPKFRARGVVLIHYLEGQRLKQYLFPELPENAWPVVSESHGFLLLHFLGPVYEPLLRAALPQGEPEMTVNELVAATENNPMREIRKIERDRLERFIASSYKRFARVLGLGAFFSDLPLELQEREVIDHLDPAGFLDFLRSRQLQEVEMDDRVAVVIGSHRASTGG
jgi:ATP-dependent Lhr-like helicase